jgi:hypothetical protein
VPASLAKLPVPATCLPLRLLRRSRTPESAAAGACTAGRPLPSHRPLCGTLPATHAPPPPPARLQGNLGRFINHSCEPNCETQKWVAHGELAIGLFTLDDIPAGAELTFDYNFERYGDKVRAVRCGWGGGAKHLRGSAVRHRWVSMAAAGCGGLQRQRRLGRGGERGAGGGGCCSGGGCLAGGCRQHARPHPSWRVPFSIRVCSLTGLLFPGLGPCPCPPSSP